MKKYKLSSSFTYKPSSGSGHYNLKEQNGQYRGKHGYVMLGGTVPKEDGKFIVGMQLVKDGTMYCKEYEFLPTATVKGILRVAKQFHDETYEPALHMFKTLSKTHV